jgi:hypothetical protein
VAIVAWPISFYVVLCYVNDYILFLLACLMARGVAVFQGLGHLLTRAFTTAIRVQPHVPSIGICALTLVRLQVVHYGHDSAFVIAVVLVLGHVRLSAKGLRMSARRGLHYPIL